MADSHLFAPDYDAPIDYMRRTREYYLALGYDNPYRWAHYVDAPFQPLRKKLRDSTLALITTAAPYQPDKGDQGPGAPYNSAAKFYQVYSGDTPVATTEEYAQQAEEIATATPSAEPQKGDWLPLGVFAITQDGQASGTEPSQYMQLAISKQSAISGTLKNTLTGKTQTLEGMADKKSQRVAWAVSGQERPIMETGLSNLTQDASPALIHFADGQTQQWLMVRIPEPKE
jgi:hypothetical protein